MEFEFSTVFEGERTGWDVLSDAGVRSLPGSHEFDRFCAPPSVGLQGLQQGTPDRAPASVRWTRKAHISLHGTGNSNSHGTRPVLSNHLDDKVDLDQ